jgi:hypothetical protein
VTSEGAKSDVWNAVVLKLAEKKMYEARLRAAESRQ